MSSDSESDNDGALQELLLHKLQEYGDQMLGDKDSVQGKDDSGKIKKKLKQKDIKDDSFRQKVKHRKNRLSSDALLEKRQDASNRNSDSGKQIHEPDSLRDETETASPAKRKRKAKEMETPLPVTKAVEYDAPVQTHRTSDSDDGSDGDSDTCDIEEDEFPPGSSNWEWSDLDDDQNSDAQTNTAPSNSKLKQLEKFKSYIGITDADMEKLGSRKKAVAETVQERACQKQGRVPEVIVFHDPAKKKKKTTSAAVAETKVESGDPQNMRKQNRAHSQQQKSEDFDLDSARMEVRKFAIRGMSGERKEEGMAELLIRLGAKPPKKKCINYKEFQKIRKQQMMQEQEKRELDRKLGHKVDNHDKRRRFAKPKRGKNDVGTVDGQIGSYRGGVQKLQKHDLERLSKTRKGKKR